MKAARRIQQNLLAASERRLLDWLCARLPGWVTPDQLTALGFLGSVIICAGYALSSLRVEWLWLAIFGYFVSWFGDSLDGSIARWRKIERPSYGYFLDHSVDGIANLIAIGGIGLSPFVRVDAALFALSGYLLLSIHAFLAARVMGEMKLSYLAAGPTELRLMLIAMTLTMFAVGPDPVLANGWSAFDIFAVAVGSLLVILFVVQTLVTARRLRDRTD